MKAEGIDERALESEHHGANFLIFIYERDDDDHVSWSVDSYLLTDADLPAVFGWLRDNLPANCCWSLGVVAHPSKPTPDSKLEVSWIVGSDVLNQSAATQDLEEQRLAEEMMARRHQVPAL